MSRRLRRAMSRAHRFLAWMTAVLLCAGAIAGALTGTATATAAAAQTPDPANGAVALTPEDRADIARVETYLEGFGTLKARFLQIAPNGALSQGMLYIARPDKLRVEYDGAVPFLIVATGKLLVLYDGELQQTSYLPLHSSPASVLIRERIDLSDEMIVREIERAPGALRLKLVEQEDPAKGAIYLTFADQPLRLREWTVIDAEGQATQVALVNAEFGLELDPVLFMYIAPGPDQFSQ
ncbi:MAG: LolA family protein [Alphaproteobacteria bacterium]